jgi:hypothetical protein
MTNSDVAQVTNFNISTGAVISSTTAIDTLFKYFNGIKNIRNPSWSPAIVSKLCDSTTSQCPVFVIFTFPIFNASRNVVDYMGSSSFATSSLSQELYEISSTIPDCVIVIIEKKTGSILASSDLGTSTIINSTLATGLNYNNNHVKLSTAQIRSQYGNFYEKIGNNPGLTVSNSFQIMDAQNTVIFVNFAYVEDDYGIEWIAVVTVPQNSLSGNQIGQIVAMAVFSLLAILICMILGFISSMILFRPLYILIEKMKLVEQFELEFMQGYRLSYFTEVRAMQTSFGVMCEKLKQYKAFLPASVIYISFSNKHYRSFTMEWMTIATQTARMLKLSNNLASLRTNLPMNDPREK